MPEEAPTLLRLALDTLLRHHRGEHPQSSRMAAEKAGGAFWAGKASVEDEPTALPQLPLPVDVKLNALAQLRAAGSLDDASLLLLCDPSIGSLNLRGARQLTGGGSLCHLDALCPRLATLDLSWCWQLEDADLVELPSSLPLESLSLRGCRRLSAAAVWTLVGRLRALRCLRLCGCDELDTAPPREPPLRLEALSISGTALDSKALAQLSVACPSLRAIVLRDSAAVDDAVVGTLLRRCAQLQHLDLCGCGGVRGTFLLRAGHENLQSLLLGNCGALGSAVVRRPSRASRRVLRAGASALDGLAGQAGLVTGAVGGAPTVTGGLQRAAQWLRGGHDASSSDDNDSDEERPLDHALVGELTRGRSNGVGFPLLSRLVLVGGGWLRAPFVAAAAERCPALVELIIGVHGGLSPGGRFVRSPLPHLLELTLVRCEASASTLACLKACPHLRKLTLRRCTGFGAAAAEELHGLTALRTVALCGVKPHGDGVDVESEEAWLDGVRAATPAHAALEVVESVDAGAAGESVDRWASSVADADAF